MSDDRVLADNSVAPDDKDWTWVLTRPCDECGFDARSFDSDDPLFPNWDQNTTAVSERYGEQDPARVAEELLVAASAVATSFDSVSGVDWQRPGRRSDGASFTIESFARYMVHDPIHHMWDVAGR